MFKNIEMNISECRNEEDRLKLRRRKSQMPDKTIEIKAEPEKKSNFIMWSKCSMCVCASAWLEYLTTHILKYISLIVFAVNKPEKKVTARKRAVRPPIKYLSSSDDDGSPKKSDQEPKPDALNKINWNLLKCNSHIYKCFSLAIVNSYFFRFFSISLAIKKYSALIIFIFEKTNVFILQLEVFAFAKVFDENHYRENRTLQDKRRIWPKCAGAWICFLKTG